MCYTKGSEATTKTHICVISSGSSTCHLHLICCWVWLKITSSGISSSEPWLSECCFYVSLVEDINPLETSINKETRCNSPCRSESFWITFIGEIILDNSCWRFSTKQKLAISAAIRNQVIVYDQCKQHKMYFSWLTFFYEKNHLWYHFNPAYRFICSY